MPLRTLGTFSADIYGMCFDWLVSVDYQLTILKTALCRSTLASVSSHRVSLPPFIFGYIIGQYREENEHPVLYVGLTHTKQLIVTLRPRDFMKKLY